ncbi:hypothetical protein NDU88_003940 [Pleurodeles waltl]|uniref:Uncharacterized protein n=1 Tax=Pleurodeles waltl TaxID=8319 RepID=A0AAV7UF47_PLEWA|nr:hypothetical protein NDU88_003940 [Pleurodeles waltl]
MILSGAGDCSAPANARAQCGLSAPLTGLAASCVPQRRTTKFASRPLGSCLDSNLPPLPLLCAFSVAGHPALRGPVFCCAARSGVPRHGGKAASFQPMREPDVGSALFSPVSPNIECDTDGRQSLPGSPQRQDNHPDGLRSALMSGSSVDHERSSD